MPYFNIQIIHILSTINMINRINNINIITLSALLITGMIIAPVSAKHLHKEAEYQEVWCDYNKGTMEVKLQDYTRVDCLTDTHAIEFDFSKKWAEAIGQSLYYGLRTGKRAGIVLIMENPKKDKYYLKRVVDLAKVHNIDVWSMTGLTLEEIKKEYEYVSEHN